MKRFAAVLAAVVMVLAAVLVRALVAGEDARGDDGDTGDDGLEIICGPELLAACNDLAAEIGGLRVTQQPEADTAEAIVTGELTLGAGSVWLAAGDWVAITSAGMATDTGPPISSDVLARSPAVMVARTDRMEVLRAACGEVDWSCVGDSAGDSWTGLGGERTWGRVEVALPSPDSAPGMVASNQAVASRIGTTDFATNDLAEPSVAGWLDSLSSASASNSGAVPPLEDFIGRPAALSVVGALEADAVRVLRDAASAELMTVVAPAPVATADVRLWSGSTGSLERALGTLTPERLAEALAGSGWRPGDGRGTEPPTGAASIGAEMLSLAVELPDGPGLPSPGTIFTVDQRFEDAK